RDAAAFSPGEDFDVQEVLGHRALFPALRLLPACSPKRTESSTARRLRRRTGVTDQAREELRKWLDVSAYARRFESRHVVVASLQWDDGPGIATGREHQVHEEAAHPSVPVIVGV